VSVAGGAGARSRPRSFRSFMVEAPEWIRAASDPSSPAFAGGLEKFGDAAADRIDDRDHARVVHAQRAEDSDRAATAARQRVAHQAAAAERQVFVEPDAH